jgi:hypothetical protein
MRVPSKPGFLIRGLCPRSVEGANGNAACKCLTLAVAELLCHMLKACNLQDTDPEWGDVNQGSQQDGQKAGLSGQARQAKGFRLAGRPGTSTLYLF